MSVLDIVIYPDPRLTQKCEKVLDFNKDLHKLLDNMAETMYEADGIGIAAPQVGVVKQITVIDVSEKRNEVIEFINPIILNQDGNCDSDEGCLSIPGYRGTVKRFEQIAVQAQNRKGEIFEIAADELLAICLQHEIDHLHGVLFVDKLSRLKKELFKKWLKKQTA